MKYKKLAELIKSSRKKQKLTQLELANHLGVHLQQVSNFERGICKIPVDKFRRACELLKISRMTLYFVMKKDEQDNFTHKFNKMWNP